MVIDPSAVLATTAAITQSPAVSGVAAIALRAPTEATEGAAQPPASASSPPASATSLTLQAAVASAVASQVGLSRLLSDLTRALQSPNLPGDVRAAAAQIVNAQVSLDPPPTGQDLQQAISQSGLFLEAQLAETGAPPDSDVKAALLNLIQTLEPLASPDGSGAPVLTGPPPPSSGAPLQGQPPATPLLAQDAAMELVAALLSKEVKGALSRQVLMQAASVPKSGPVSSQGAAQRSGASWLFDLLFAAPDGPAVAQFQIDRDGAPPRDGAPDPIWRARFSLDFAPLGAIHARISLSGGQAHVALWAENDETRTQLDAQQGDLVDALLEDQLIPQVAVFQGKPNVAPAPAGQFMNRAV